MIAATLMGYAVPASGLLAALIVVSGFVAHARPALRGASEEELREATTIGGIAGLAIGSVVMVLSAVLDKV